jgi:hypothetical protein
MCGRCIKLVDLALSPLRGENSSASLTLSSTDTLSFAFSRMRDTNLLLLLLKNHSLYKFSIRSSFHQKTVFGSIVVSISACHSKEQLAGGRGSIPRQRDDTVLFALFVRVVVVVCEWRMWGFPASTPLHGCFSRTSVREIIRVSACLSTVIFCAFGRMNEGCSPIRYGFLDGQSICVSTPKASFYTCQSYSILLPKRVLFGMQTRIRHVVVGVYVGSAEVGKAMRRTTKLLRMLLQTTLRFVE